MIFLTICFPGKALEEHCRVEILQPALDEIRWGDIGAPTARGGLRDLRAALARSESAAPRHLGAVQRGMQLCAELGTAASRSLVRRGATHTAVTGMMAREFERALGWEDENAQKPLPCRDSDTLFDNDLDKSFAEQFSAAKDGRERLTTKRAASMQTGGKVHTRARESAAARKALMDDISFEMDTAFMKLKEKDLLERDQNLPSATTEAGGNSSFFLRFTVRDALFLPKMSEKESYDDTYCRCYLQCDKVVLSGPKGHCRCETRCIWNSRDPKWDQEFVFVFTLNNLIDRNVSLVVEVFDVNLGKHGLDNKVGQVCITVFHDGIVWMPTDLECEETYKIMDDHGNPVRCNNGIVRAEKLGRPSVLRMKTFLSNRPELQPAMCAVLIQQNVRCLLARRKVRKEKSAVALLRAGCKLGLVQTELQAEALWKYYVEVCAKGSTTAIRDLKDQLTRKKFRLKNYAITHAGASCLAQLCNRLLRIRELRCLSLTSAGLNSRSIATLVSLLIVDEDLNILVLDHNPISAGKKNHSQTDSSTASIESSGVASLAQFIRNSSSLNLLSLAHTELNSLEISEIASSAAENSALQILNLSDNMQDQRLHLSTAVSISDALKRKKDIIELNFSQYCLSFAAAEVLLHCFFSTKLRRIHLRSTGIGRSEKAVNILALFLERIDCQLDYADLGSNDIDSKGALRLSRSLRKNCSLLVLILDGNPLKELGYFLIFPQNGRAKMLSNSTKESADPYSQPRPSEGGIKISIFSLFEIFVDWYYNLPNQKYLLSSAKELAESFSFPENNCLMQNFLNELTLSNCSADKFRSFYDWYALYFCA